MNSTYILLPGNRLFFDRGLALYEGRVIDLPADIQKILKVLTYRPLWEDEFNSLPDNWKNLFKKICSYYGESYPLSLEADYEEATSQEAIAWKIIAHEEIILHWGIDQVSCKKGHYFFIHYRPEKIEGPYEIFPLKSSHPTLARDQWILDQIHQSPLKTILELGSGDERLFKKIKKRFPEILYKGIDLAPSTSSLKGDFLLNYPEVTGPHIVILEEVIEHLSEEESRKLILKTIESGGAEIILTTPNKTFTELLGRELRHPDHQFEWDKAEIQSFAEKLQQERPCTVKLEEIGKKLKGTAPTWGLIIKFQEPS